MPTVEGAGVELAYEDEGTDPPTTLVVHGMASGAGGSTALRVAARGAGHRPRSPGLRRLGRARALRGHDGAGAGRGRRGAAAARWRPRPCRIVGFGFGALIALDLLVRRPELVASAVALRRAAARVRARGQRGARAAATTARGGAARRRPAGRDRALARPAARPRRSSSAGRRRRAGSSRTTRAWPRGRPAAASCAASPCRWSSSPGRTARRTWSGRRTRRRDWSRRRRGAWTATSSRPSEATDYTAEPVPAPHRCAPLR